MRNPGGPGSGRTTTTSVSLRGNTCRFLQAIRGLHFRDPGSVLAAYKVAGGTWRPGLVNDASSRPWPGGAVIVLASLPKPFRQEHTRIKPCDVHAAVLTVQSPPCPR